MVWIWSWNQNRNCNFSKVGTGTLAFFKSRNRNHNFSKVGTGTVKNSYCSTTLNFLHSRKATGFPMNMRESETKPK
jgi:hypothetical protein